MAFFEYFDTFYNIYIHLFCTLLYVLSYMTCCAFLVCTLVFVFGLFMSLELPVTRVVVRPDGLEANGHCVFEVVFRLSFGVR